MLEEFLVKSMAKIYYGPYHPAFKEPLGIILEIEGEMVENAEISLGYMHRQIEKILEKTNWVTGMVIASKVCGICSSVHANTYSQAVEMIYRVEIPERAKYIRMIELELERLQSHLLWFGTFMHEIGFETLFMWFWDDRERILELMEEISGRRIGWMLGTPGGVRRDIREEQAKKIKNLIRYLRKRFEKYEKILKTESTILMRTRKVGIIKKRDAEEFGCVGPIARASGVKRDVRYQEPYLFYEESPYEIVMLKDGDAYSRMMVRFYEMKNSLDIIEWVLDNIKGREILRKINPLMRPSEGEAISRMEAPRGELFYFVRSKGEITPERVRIRTPTFANLPILTKMFEGVYLADVPAVAFSFDPCIACMERFVIVKEDKKEIMTREELLEYSRRWFKEHYDEIKRERLC